MANSRNEDAALTPILMKLDRIIKLLAVTVATDKPQLQRIALLSSAGLSPKEIAEALGTTSNTVRVALVGVRKARRGKRKRT
jgi:DNA-binding NarL/FixJ family response regulator